MEHGLDRTCAFLPFDMTSAQALKKICSDMYYVVSIGRNAVRSQLHGKFHIDYMIVQAFS